MIRLTVGTEAFDELDVVVGLAAEVVGDLTHEWENVVAPWFLDHMRQQFESQGEHGGEPWAAYNQEPQYAAVKSSIFEEEGVDGKISDFILRWVPGQERLYPSLVRSGHSHHISQFGEMEASFGTSLPYADRLIEGGTGPYDEPYPGRDMLAVTDEQQSDLFTDIQRSIRNRLSDDALREGRRKFQAQNL